MSVHLKSLHFVNSSAVSSFASLHVGCSSIRTARRRAPGRAFPARTLPWPQSRLAPMAPAGDDPGTSPPSPQVTLWVSHAQGRCTGSVKADKNLTWDITDDITLPLQYFIKYMQADNDQISEDVTKLLVNFVCFLFRKLHTLQAFVADHIPIQNSPHHCHVLLDDSLTAQWLPTDCECTNSESRGTV